MVAEIQKMFINFSIIVVMVGQSLLAVPRRYAVSPTASNVVTNRHS